MTIGIVGRLGTMASKPSTADATEIGGVIIPSANKHVAPRIVGITIFLSQNVLQEHIMKIHHLRHGYQQKVLEKHI